MDYWAERQAKAQAELYSFGTPGIEQEDEE